MFTLPELPYAYAALELVISEDIMRLHHQKHHQAYVDKLNAALQGSEHPGDIEQLLKGIHALPVDVQSAVRNQGGGHFNHSLFWQWMSPDGGGRPTGQLAKDIAVRYGDFQGFVDAFSEKANGIFGSGWAWLMPNLDIVTTQNQDNPVMEGHARPLLGLDVWEHAYYLDYKNKRDEYIQRWWGVVNWSDIEKQYGSAIIS